MPLVKPKEKEKREDFISRCMADDKTTSEFDTTEQRLAVCNSQYENNKKEKYSMNDIEKMGEAIKSLTDVISSKEKNYGGDGQGLTPMELILVGVAGCIGIDVTMLLGKNLN